MTVYYVKLNIVYVALVIIVYYQLHVVSVCVFFVCLKQAIYVYMTAVMEAAMFLPKPR